MYRFENSLLPVSFNKNFTNLVVYMHIILVASKKSNIFFQDIKQIMGKSHFNILV